jgi:Tfp pilus assembly protein PilV
VKKTAGYSLMEVMIAFAIMAIVLAALVPGQASLLRRAQVSDTALLAADYAASQLDLIGVSEPVFSGRRETRYRDWRIVETSATQPLAESAMPVHHITIEVYSILDGSLLAHLEDLKTPP